MNPKSNALPEQTAATKPMNRASSSGSPKKSVESDLNKFLPKLKKIWQKLMEHLSFIAIVLVLLVYMFVVWQIRGLVTAEPSPEDESAALSSTNISKIDKPAIDRIQSLEQNNPEVRSLFNEARNNPFHE